MNKTQLLQGTLDLLILRILELGPNHGWGISNRLAADVEGRLEDKPGLALPRASSSRDARRGEVRDDRLGEQPAGARLHDHARPVESA